MEVKRTKMVKFRASEALTENLKREVERRKDANLASWSTADVIAESLFEYLSKGRPELLENQAHQNFIGNSNKIYFKFRSK